VINTNTNNVISTAPFIPEVTNGALQLLSHEYAFLKRLVSSFFFLNTSV